MGVWDVTTPTGSDNISAGDDRIRELKIAIQEALQCTDATLGNAGNFPGSAPASAPEFAYRGHRGTSAEVAALSEDVSGIAFDTDKSAFYSYAGGSWNAVGYVIPAGTKQVFYQASAPTGWTRDTGVNDKFLTVVSAGSPGTTGGTHAASTNIGNHTHDDGDLQFRTGRLASSGTLYMYNSGGSEVYVALASDVQKTGEYQIKKFLFQNETATNLYTGTGSGDTGVTSLGSGSYASAYVMVAEKDSY